MPTALIIDDDVGVRSLIKSFLERLKIDSEEASNGVDGIQKTKHNKYDIIFLDFKMPKLDGEQVLKVLRRRKHDIPVIIISGYLTKDDVARMSGLGVNGFLTKPVHFQRFCEEVNKVYPIEMPGE